MGIWYMVSGLGRVSARYDGTRTQVPTSRLNFQSELHRGKNHHGSERFNGIVDFGVRRLEPLMVDATDQRHDPWRGFR